MQAGEVGLFGGGRRLTSQLVQDGVSVEIGMLVGHFKNITLDGQVKQAGPDGCYKPHVSIPHANKKLGQDPAAGEGCGSPLTLQIINVTGLHQFRMLKKTAEE